MPFAARLGLDRTFSKGLELIGPNLIVLDLINQGINVQDLFYAFVAWMERTTNGMCLHPLLRRMPKLKGGIDGTAARVK